MAAQNSPSESAQALPPRIAVVGPTASGKSELAVRLAERFGGEVIATDSMQVYRHLDIGTAKATPAQRARVPHRLLDMVNPDEPYSAGRYVEDASPVLARLAREGRPAVLCGGTGLYFRALLFGLARVPPVPREVRAAVQARHQGEGLDACYAELKRLDPQGAAALRPGDPARVLRALEVLLATGRPLREFQQASPFRSCAENLISVGVHWERPALYARINRRVEEMLAAGWVEEVRRVLGMGYGAYLKPLRAIGYGEICAVLAGEADEAGLAGRIAQRTRRYAKRQLTWFRRHPDIHWAPPDAQEGIGERVEFFLKSGR